MSPDRPLPLPLGTGYNARAGRVRCHRGPRMGIVVPAPDAALLLTVFLSVVARAAAPGHEPMSFLEPCVGIEVVARQAAVTLAGVTVATVARGRRFGVRKRREGAYEVQVFSGRTLRHGWIESEAVRELTSADVDLAAEALRIAKELNPKVDLAACTARIDAAFVSPKLRRCSMSPVKPAFKSKRSRVKRSHFNFAKWNSSSLVIAMGMA